MPVSTVFLSGGRGHVLISQGYGFQSLRSEIGYKFKDETDNKEYSY